MISEELIRRWEILTNVFEGVEYLGVLVDGGVKWGAMRELERNDLVDLHL